MTPQVDATDDAGNRISGQLRVGLALIQTWVDGPKTRHSLIGGKEGRWLRNVRGR